MRLHLISAGRSPLLATDGIPLRTPLLVPLGELLNSRRFLSGGDPSSARTMKLAWRSYVLDGKGVNRSCKLVIDATTCGSVSVLLIVGIGGLGNPAHEKGMAHPRLSAKSDEVAAITELPGEPHGLNRCSSAPCTHALVRRILAMTTHHVP